MTFCFCFCFRFRFLRLKVIFSSLSFPPLLCTYNSTLIHSLFSVIFAWLCAHTVSNPECTRFTHRDSCEEMAKEITEARSSKEITTTISDRAKEHHGNLGFPIFELPVQIILEILSKLPVKSVAHCQCVCKAFRRFIGEPYFSNLYVSRAPTSFLVQQTSNKRIKLYGMIASAPLPFTNGVDTSNPAYHRVFPVEHVTKYVKLTRSKAALVNSCNGFLCLHYADNGKDKYYICNPILDEFLSLPRPPSSEYGHIYLDYSAFGFSPKTNEYKVVRVVSKRDKVVAEVLTVGGTSWRIVDGAPAGRPCRSLDPFVNGALHWVTDSPRSSEIVCSFVLDKEMFMPVPLPSHFDVDFEKKVPWINVGALGGCLCLCYDFEGVNFDVWVMNEYGVKESWTKKFSIDIEFYCGLQLGEKHRPIGFTREGEMWLNCDSCSLVSYCPRKRSFKEITGGTGSTIEAIPYTAGFVSLSHAVKENKRIKLGKNRCIPQQGPFTQQQHQI